MSKRTSIYIGPALRTYLDERTNDGAYGSTSGIINAAADRLSLLYKHAMPNLSEAEWNLIFDCCNGSVLEPAENAVWGLVLNVEDSIVLDGTDEKWEVDGPALITKLKALDRTGILAIVDKAERFWAAQ
ncbi:MAG: type II toxin-antitoxin system ParD family antitoxin [Proteobacteria bacterium]|nr:type II toxin-antitoxin system ParD family antitoxin [Pseudomonadota bacterium]MBU1610710.1 type II toxin-antitoxin system ParD family antitoxin [Pseudomonadota bacterium]